jgi:hypothetical protein
VNLVNELQVSAEQDDVLTVLRKTKRLSSKLGRQDMADWLKGELEGYGLEMEVPDYRVVGTSLAYNTNGYIPAGYGFVMNGVVDLPFVDLTFPIPITASISTILSWIDGLNQGNEIYESISGGSKYDLDIRNILKVNPAVSRQISFLIHMNGPQVRAIPERIKDKVLGWACDLESAGVSGNGMSFTLQEKEIAHSITFNIRNSHIEQLNNLGSNQKGTK